MGLFGDIGRGAAGWSTGGLSELLQKDPFGAGHSDPSISPATGGGMTAAGIKLDPGLTATLGAQGKGPQNSLKAVYDRIRNNMSASRAGRGMGPAQPDNYATNRLNTAEGFSNANLKGGLEGILGSTALNEARQNRDFGQNYALAKYTGELNKPSPLEEILGALSGAANTGGQIAGASKSKRMPAANPPMSAPSYDYYGTGGSGLNLYGY